LNTPWAASATYARASGEPYAPREIFGEIKAVPTYHATVVDFFAASAVSVISALAGSVLPIRVTPSCRGIHDPGLPV